MVYRPYGSGPADYGITLRPPLAVIFPKPFKINFCIILSRRILGFYPYKRDIDS